MQSGDYSPLLRMMRDHAVPTFVLHGEKDLIVPFDSARDIADDANATLYCVPDAYHSWMITNPRHGADAFRQLLHGELGEVLRNTANALGIMDFTDATCWEDALIAPDALAYVVIAVDIEHIPAEAIGKLAAVLLLPLNARPRRRRLPSSALLIEFGAALQLEHSEGDFRRFASAIHQVACDV